MYKKFFKPLMDKLLAIILFILFSPVMILVALLIFFTMGRPILFTQDRPGYKEKIFKLYKFRTMNNKRDENGELLPDDKRLTKIGKFIRSTSLDELPQLINVLKGDMSFVGPRPLLVEYLPLYNNEQKKRHNVKPGITGWAQVNGRNAISWEEKFKHDIWYVENLSFFLDLKILFLTLIKVLNRTGVYQDKNTTMEKFQGNK